MKYDALALILIGLLIVGIAYHRDVRSSFEDGSFLVMIVLYLAGVGCCVVGVGMLAIRLFRAI